MKNTNKLEINTQTLSTQQAAKMLGVSQRTTQLWVENGTLNAWKTAGGHRRIYLKSVQEVLFQSGQQSANSHGTPLTILVINGDPEALAHYKNQITAWHTPTKLYLAQNGHEGLVMLGIYNPELLIIDATMLNMDGLEMIQNLKNIEALQKTKIIMVTHRDGEGITRFGETTSNVEIHHKPLSFDLLEQRVSRQFTGLNPAIR